MYVCIYSKGFALTWYSSTARPFAVPVLDQLGTGQQASPSPACQQIFRARNVCAGAQAKEVPS